MNGDWESVQKQKKCLYFHRQAQLCLSVHVEDFDMVSHSVDLDEVYLGCTQGAAESNEEMIHGNKHFQLYFHPSERTTNLCLFEHIRKSHPGTMMCKNTPRYAVSQVMKAETPCTHDHQPNREDFEVIVELASVCAQILLWPESSQRGPKHTSTYKGI